jgi:hypothetical protein
MNAKPNSIEKVTATTAYLRLGGLKGPSPAYEVRLPQRPLLVKAQAQPGLIPAEHPPAESWLWEALSYAVLWLCGLSGIALSFR